MHKLTIFLSFFAAFFFMSVETASAQQEQVQINMRGYKLIRSLGGGVSCDMYFDVENKTNNEVKKLSLSLKWPSISTNLSFGRLSPRDTAEKHYHLLGTGCRSMPAVKPKLTVKTCKMTTEAKNPETGEVTSVAVDNETCSALIRWQ